MAAPKWVTLRSQWLGAQLRQLREANDLLLKDAADYLQRDPSTVSRFESGEYPIRRPDLMALLDLYGVAKSRHREAFLRLSEEVWQKGWWDGYADEVAAWLIDYVWLESRARQFRTFDNTLVLGLLQTEPYARAAITAAEPDGSAEYVERGLEMRMARQAILDRDNPPRLSIILDEAVLRREVGGRDVLTAQLYYLAECAKHPNVEIRVLPFAAGAHASPSGAFRILTMEKLFPEIAYAETPKGAIYVESPDTERLVRTYDLLQELSLDPDESAELISTVAEESQ